jgi:hypothetical protein
LSLSPQWPATDCYAPTSPRFVFSSDEEDESSSQDDNCDTSEDEPAWGGRKQMKLSTSRRRRLKRTVRDYLNRAQCLSSDKFPQAVAEIEAEKNAKAAGKEAKKVERQRRKEMKEEIEKERVRMKQHHAVEVEAWSTKCSELTAGGAKKKDLPPKHRLGKKPQVPAADDNEEDDEEEPVEEEDV